MAKNILPGVFNGRGVSRIDILFLDELVVGERIGIDYLSRAFALAIDGGFGYKRYGAARHFFRRRQAYGVIYAVKFLCACDSLGNSPGSGDCSLPGVHLFYRGGAGFVGSLIGGLNALVSPR